jgi:Pyruvate/2-oxoacid:ferredoxin oxidoreductase gamma subunit
LQDNSIAVINEKEIVLEELPSTIVKVGFVDATSIALKYLKLPIVNTTMLGAFAKTTGWMSLESLKEGIREFLPEPLHDRNIKCLVEGFEQTEVISRK